MFDPRTEPSDRNEFDLICATLEDYEHLPELIPGPSRWASLTARGQEEETIDAEILAGLVFP